MTEDPDETCVACAAFHNQSDYLDRIMQTNAIVLFFNAKSCDVVTLYYQKLFMVNYIAIRMESGHVTALLDKSVHWRGLAQNCAVICGSATAIVRARLQPAQIMRAVIDANT